MCMPHGLATSRGTEGTVVVGAAELGAPQNRRSLRAGTDLASE